MPIYPNIGYNNLTNFENPILDTMTAVTHISIAYIRFCFLFFAIFFNNLVPSDALVVNIELNIIKPYIYLKKFEI